MVFLKYTTEHNSRLSSGPLADTTPQMCERPACHDATEQMLKVFNMLGKDDLHIIGQVLKIVGVANITEVFLRHNTLP